MNAEHLLDAIGLLDDSLIREAEEYRRPRAGRSYGVWLGWAASFAVVLVLGYGLTHLGMGGGNSMAPAAPSGGNEASTPAASAPASSCGGGGAEDMAPEENESPASGENGEPGAPGAQGGKFCPAIMVDGVLYRSTGRPVPAEPDPSVIQTVASYTSGTPEIDGQTNFSQDLTARYVMTDIGLLVLVEEEWTLFEPVPPGKP